jgi:hypothetical protein
MFRKCQRCNQELTLEKFTGEQKLCNICIKNKHNKLCEECSKQSSFGLESEGRRRWCKEHSPPDAINLISKKCEKCSKRANFGLKSEGKKRWCKEHAFLNAIDLKHKKCEQCSKISTFGLESEGKVRWCKEHAPLNAINLKDKKCEKCFKRPNFGLESEGKVRWCKEHALDNAIDLKHEKCEKCPKRSNFGLESEGKARWCKEHSQLDAINLKNKRCEKCFKRPTFGLAFEGKARWCKEHSEVGVIDLKSKKCEECFKIPNFGLESEGKARWCKEHSLLDAINLKDKKCEKCNTRANYNIIGCMPNRCMKHKEEGMLKNPKAKCLKKNCNNLAIYGCTRRQIHCEEHKNNNDILLAEYKCKNCGTLDILTDKGVCVSYCALDEKFKEFKKYEKKDEKRILKLLTDKFGEPTSYDKIIINDCGYKERPDIVYDFIESKVRIIIEVDENGDNHGTNCDSLSQEENELNRMKNIFYSFAETTHTIFIRYNPNTFYNNGVKNKMAKTDREKILIKWIDKIKNDNQNIFLNSPLATIYLFYNEYTPNISTFKTINILKNKIYNCKKCLENIDYKYNKIPKLFLFYDKQEYQKHKTEFHQK